jgi:hypothetical protein
MVALFVSHACAQEIDPTEKDIREWVARSDVVLTGAFHARLRLPWIDGWHYWATLDVERVLLSKGSQKSFPFRWTTPYGASCVRCDLGRMDGAHGIWFLRRRGGGWEFSGGDRCLCGGKVEPRFLGVVKQAIANRARH